MKERRKKLLMLFMCTTLVGTTIIPTAVFADNIEAAGDEDDELDLDDEEDDLDEDDEGDFDEGDEDGLDEDDEDDLDEDDEDDFDDDEDAEEDIDEGDGFSGEDTGSESAGGLVKFNTSWYYAEPDEQIRLDYTADSDVTLEWSVSDEDIASISSAGVVSISDQAESETIEVTLTADGYDSATAYIFVSSPELESKSGSVKKGKSKTVSVYGLNADKADVTCKSSNTSVATAVYDKDDEEITITGKATGKSVITLTVNDKSTVTYNVTVTADKAVSVTKKLTVKKGKTKRIVVKNATGKIKYKSANKKIASVSGKGVVKGKKTGKTQIIVTANGKSYTCKVTVKK